MWKCNASIFILNLFLYTIYSLDTLLFYMDGLSLTLCLSLPSYHHRHQQPVRVKLFRCLVSVQLFLAAFYVMYVYHVKSESFSKNFVWWFMHTHLFMFFSLHLAQCARFGNAIQNELFTKNFFNRFASGDFPGLSRQLVGIWYKHEFYI